MDLVHGLVLGCLFLIGLCAISHYARNSALPYVCWVVLAGVGYGLLQGCAWITLPFVQLSPDTILYIFLPVLVFDSSRKLDLNVAKEVATPSILLATLGILTSMFVMALPIHFWFGLPWMDTLLFCAIMSATDPVAVAAVFDQFSVPRKLKVLLEGESLLNDGTTVILFSLLFGKVIEGQELLFSRGVLSFVLSVFGAILIGGVGGWACVALLRYWKALKNHFIAPLMPILFVYLIFSLAQATLHVSGVIAVMAATLVMRIVLKRCNKEELPSRPQLVVDRGLWEFVADLANAILFFILGAEIGSYSGQMSWVLIGVSLLSLLVARSVVVYGFGAFFRNLPLPWLHVLNLGGLKGALSIALILMIPESYAYRHEFLCAALGMCIFTLVANPLALRRYLKKNEARMEHP